MKASQVKVEELPVIRVSGDRQAEEMSLEQLKERGANGNGYGLSVGETVEFPDSLEDAKLMSVPTSGNNSQTLVLVLKNGKPAWFGLSNLRRQDAQRQPVHPVAEYIAKEIAEKAMPVNDHTRLSLVVGKKITATEAVEYDEAVWVDGRSTDDTTPRTTAKLIFA